MIVTDLVYDKQDDVLIAGTWGRGAWKLPSISTSITQTAKLQINGTPDRDIIKIALDDKNPSLLAIFQDQDQDGNFDRLSYPAIGPIPLSTVETIEVLTGGGSDKLIVDSSVGTVYMPGGIAYKGGEDSGGGDHDVLTLASEPEVSSYEIERDTDPGTGALHEDGSATVIMPEDTWLRKQRIIFEEIEEPVETLLYATDWLTRAGSGLAAVAATSRRLDPAGRLAPLDRVVAALCGVDPIELTPESDPTGAAAIEGERFTGNEILHGSLRTGPTASGSRRSARC